MRRIDWRRAALHAVGIAIALVALVAYVRTLAPTVVGGDPSELQLLVRRLGVPHGTGYPLYVWLGHLFVSLPFGYDIAYRLNLFSAVLGAGAVWVAYLLALEIGVARTLAARAVGAGAAAALVARSHTFWSVSIIAEEYTLHVVMALVSLLLLVRWMRTGSRTLLYAGFATLGAMFGNHAMTFGLVPAVAVFVLLRERMSKALARTLAGAVAAGALGALVCNVLLFYLLWRRHLPYDHWQWVLSCPRFFDLPKGARDSFWYAWWYEVTCRQFRHQLAGASLDQRIEQVLAMPHRMAAELFPVGAALGLFGWGLLWKRWRESVLVTLVLATHVYLVASLSVTLKSHVYLLVASILVTIAAGGAVGWLGETPLRWLCRTPRSARFAPSVALAGALACLLASSIANELSRPWYASNMERAYARANDRDVYLEAVVGALGPHPDRHEDRYMRARASGIVDAVPPDAIVLADWRLRYAIEYVARIDRGIEGITVLEPYPYGTRRREFVLDYLDFMRDPNRVRPVFFVLPADAPPIDGYHIERRHAVVGELVPNGRGSG